MKNGLVERIDAHAERLRALRPGIAAYVAREALRLDAKLEAAQALPAGQWRDLSVRAVEHQLAVLDLELGRLGGKA